MTPGLFASLLIKPTISSSVEVAVVVIVVGASLANIALVIAEVSVVARAIGAAAFALHAFKGGTAVGIVVNDAIAVVIVPIALL